MSKEILLVDLSFEEEELLQTPSPSPDSAPGPPDCPHPDQMENLTRTVPPKHKFRFNQNHSEVPDELLLPLEKDIQRKVALANTRMAAKTKSCRTRLEFDNIVRQHQQAIRQLSAATKSLIIKMMKSQRLPPSKEELKKIRFAVSKRFTVWVQALDGVLADKSTWDDRSHLWTALVEANRHHYDVYYLRRSLNI